MIKHTPWIDVMLTLLKVYKIIFTEISFMYRHHRYRHHCISENHVYVSLSQFQ